MDPERPDLLAYGRKGTFDHGIGAKAPRLERIDPVEGSFVDVGPGEVGIVSLALADLHYLFDSIEEVQEFATRWLWTYNHERPNMAIGGITPKQKLALAA